MTQEQPGKQVLILFRQQSLIQQVIRSIEDVGHAQREVAGERRAQGGRRRADARRHPHGVGLRAQRRLEGTPHPGQDPHQRVDAGRPQPRDAHALPRERATAAIERRTVYLKKQI